MAVLAIDIGGTQMKYALVTRDGRLLNKQSQSTPDTYAKLLETIVQLASEGPDIQATGLSTPGIFDRQTGRITGSSALSYWVGQAPKIDLAECVSSPIFIENDGNSALLGERWRGAGIGQDNLAMLVVGSAVGGALMVDGHLLRGAHANAGELGYMLVDNRPPKAKFSSLGGKIGFKAALTKFQEFNPQIDSGESLFLAMEHDHALRAEYEQLLDFLCAGIVSLQYIVDPDTIIIGGGISQNAGFSTMLQQRLETMRTLRPNYKVWPNVVMAEQHNDANLLGAAWNAYQLLPG